MVLVGIVEGLQIALVELKRQHPDSYKSSHPRAYILGQVAAAGDNVERYGTPTWSFKDSDTSDSISILLKLKVQTVENNEKKMPSLSLLLFSIAFCSI